MWCHSVARTCICSAAVDLASKYNTDRVMSVPAAGAATAAATPAGAAEAPALEGQDQLLEYCLLAGLRRVPTSELPCLTSDFYSKYMLPAKPAGMVPCHAVLHAVAECVAQVQQCWCHVSCARGSSAALAAYLPMHEQRARLGSAHARDFAFGGRCKRGCEEVLLQEAVQAAHHL